jgi:hypothetical protein
LVWMALSLGPEIRAVNEQSLQGRRRGRIDYADGFDQVPGGEETFFFWRWSCPLSRAARVETALNSRVTATGVVAAR